MLLCQVAGAPGSAIATPFFLWFYLLFALVLLINLLIAMFNSEYMEIMHNSDNEWKMSKVNKIYTYMAHYVVPVPFNLIVLPWPTDPPNPRPSASTLSHTPPHPHHTHSPAHHPSTSTPLHPPPLAKRRRSCRRYDIAFTLSIDAYNWCADACSPAVSATGPGSRAGTWNSLVEPSRTVRRSSKVHVAAPRWSWPQNLIFIPSTHPPPPTPLHPHTPPPLEGALRVARGVATLQRADYAPGRRGRAAGHAMPRGVGCRARAGGRGAGGRARPTARPGEARRGAGRARLGGAPGRRGEA